MSDYLQYRFKTEQEFIKDYGLTWRARVNWNQEGKMDHLLGNIFPKKIKKEYINDPFFRENLKDKYINFEWSIFSYMITEIEKIPNYKPKKKIKRKI